MNLEDVLPDDDTEYRLTPHGMVVVKVLDEFPLLSLDDADSLAHRLADDAIELALKREREK